MQYIDERVIFDFSDVTSNYDGVYRYDVLIDSTTIFVGNTFIEINTKPVIDITEILKNYYDTNHNFTDTPTKSNIICSVTVVLYNKQQTDEESMTEDVCFIYRQPNYNSLVTTPMLEDLNTQNIATMPMLQGWDYSINKGEFLPTYPKVDSCNLTFDFVGCYQNMTMVNDFSVNYNNGLVDNPHYVSIQGNGVYQYSLPMCLLLRGIEEEYTETPKATDYLDWRGSGWKIDTSTNGLRLERWEDNYNNVTKVEYTYHFEDGSQSSLYTLDDTESISTIFKGESTQIFEKPIKRIIFKFYNGSTLLAGDLTIVVKLPDDTEESTFTVSLLNNRANTPGTIFYIALELVRKNVATICDANSINITTFTPVNSSQRYSYKIANLDGKSRYFLKWRDRYGMPQIQPFKGTHTYSESTTKNSITNYKNIKRLTDVAVNSKWKLNTDWISESLYPYYESIFVSPWLQLYDVKEDKLYSVIITDTEYTEKTFKNQNRSLFNLQLEVELDSTQTIIY